MGVLPVLAKEVVRVILKRRPLKEAYPGVSKKVLPILEEQYYPLLKDLAQKYNNSILEHKKSDTVYSSWMQGFESAPDLVKLCLTSREKYINGKKFVLITTDNIHEYVKLPKYIEDLCDKGVIPYSHSTDLVRLELLIKYGGSWIDSTVLFTGDSYPREILDSELFLFRYQNNKDEDFTGISSWFISAYSNNKLLLILRDMLYQYWKDYGCLIDYFVLHKFFWMITKEFPEEFEAVPKHSSYDALQMSLVLEKPYNEDLYKRMTALSCIHKLDYRKNRTIATDGLPTFYKKIIENNT